MGKGRAIWQRSQPIEVLAYDQLEPMNELDIFGCVRQRTVTLRSPA
jgi:hypothetical protein